MYAHAHTRTEKSVMLLRLKYLIWTNHNNVLTLLTDVAFSPVVFSLDAEYTPFGLVRRRESCLDVYHSVPLVCLFPRQFLEGGGRIRIWLFPLEGIRNWLVGQTKRLGLSQTHMSKVPSTAHRRRWSIKIHQIQK